MTTFANRPLQTVVRETPVIIRGHVRESNSGYDINGSGRIFTYTRITISEVLKGPLSDQEIIVRQPGGSVNDMALAVPGSAKFTPNEEVVLLLSPSRIKDQAYDMPGLASGKYNVEKNETGESILVNALPLETGYSTPISLAEFRRLAQNEVVETGQKLQFQIPKEAAPPLPSNQANRFEEKTQQPERFALEEKPFFQKSSLWLGGALFVLAVFIALKAKRR